MTARQAAEAERIQHRLGRVRIRDARPGVVAVEVLTDAPDAVEPAVVVELDPDGRPLAARVCQIEPRIVVTARRVLAELQERPDAEWTATDVAVTVGIDRREATAVLVHLLDDGAVEQTSGRRYVLAGAIV